MPSPGKPRYGSREALFVPESQAIYLEMSPLGGGSLTINEEYVFPLSVEHLSGYVSPQSPWVSVNVFALDGDTHLCFSVSCTKIGKGEHVSLRWSAEGYAANVQRYSGSKWHAVPLSQLEQIKGPLGEVSSVVSWELQSQHRFASLLLVAEAVGICGFDERIRHDDACRSIISRASTVARETVQTLHSWPSWRPYNAILDWGELQRSDDLADWDRGNWANGFLPAAYATALLLARAYGMPLQAEDPELKFQEQALGPILSERYPSTTHWIRRSTNHAAIILGNLIGAELMISGCESTSEGKKLRDVFDGLLDASFDEGVYLESLSYGEVFLAESTFGAWVTARCERIDLQEGLERYFGHVLREFSTISRKLTSSSGRRWLHYGDSSDYLWREDMRNLMALYQADWMSLPVREALYPGIALKTGGSDAEESGDPTEFTCEVLGDSGLALAESWVDQTPVAFGLTSMPYHRTHNRDWDLGALTVRVGDGPVIGELRQVPRSLSRSARSHTVTWIEPNRNPGCTMGPGGCRGRAVDGALQMASKGEHSCRLFARSNFPRQLSRWLDVSATDDAVLGTLVDVARLSDGERMVANFVRDSTVVELKPVLASDQLEVRFGELGLSGLEASNLTVELDFATAERDGLEVLISRIRIAPTGCEESLVAQTTDEGLHVVGGCSESVFLTSAELARRL